MEPFDWASLETDINADGDFAPTTKAATSQHAKTVKFPCGGCGGSGLWRGRGKCFACAGRGYFLTSEHDRRHARASAAGRKERKLAADGAAFDAANPGVRAFLQSATWSPFLQELLGKLGQYGTLTDGQLAALQRTIAKTEATRAARAAERQLAEETVDLSTIRAMFEAARASGYKRPVYRAAGLVISRASDIGRNPGALYVKTEDDDVYLGKIIGTQYTGKPAPALQAIAADPRGEAIRYGQKTGRCSCCGRELTAEASVEAGIGPICATKWGL